MEYNNNYKTEFKIFNSDTLEYVTSIFTHPDNIGRIKLGKTAKDKFLTCVGIIFLIVAFFAYIKIDHHNSIKTYKNSIAELNNQIEFIENETEIISLIGGYYIIGKNSDPLSDSLARDILESCGAWYPDVIIAQMKLESDNFQSNVGKNALNGFGMRKIKERGRHRPTTQVPGVDYHGYGVYVNWQLSLIDRILWDRWVFSEGKPSIDKYLQKLGDIYAEDPNYVSKIKKMTNY